MIVFTYVHINAGNPKFVAPLTNLLRNMGGKAYTKKALQLMVDELKRKAEEITNVRLEVRYDAGNYGHISIRKKESLVECAYVVEYAYALTLSIEHFVVENCIGELRDFETQADRALYHYASHYENGIVKPEEEKDFLS